MIFWICAFVAIISFVMSFLMFEKWDCDTLSGMFAGLGAISGITVAVMLLCIVTSHCNLDGEIAKLETRYDMLVYQYENDIYDNDNDLGKRELMVDIQKWNENLANLQHKQDDFWVGVFTPNIYDQFEFIELEG